MFRLHYWLPETKRPLSTCRLPKLLVSYHTAITWVAARTCDKQATWNIRYSPNKGLTRTRGCRFGRCKNRTKHYVPSKDYTDTSECTIMQFWCRAQSWHCMPNDSYNKTNTPHSTSQLDKPKKPSKSKRALERIPYNQIPYARPFSPATRALQHSCFTGISVDSGCRCACSKDNNPATSRRWRPESASPH